MKQLHEKLSHIFPETRIKSRPIDRIAYANDASYFRLVPQAVVQPESIGERANLQHTHPHRPISPRTQAPKLSQDCDPRSTACVVAAASPRRSKHPPRKPLPLRPRPRPVGQNLIWRPTPSLATLYLAKHRTKVADCDQEKHSSMRISSYKYRLGGAHSASLAASSG